MTGIGGDRKNVSLRLLTINGIALADIAVGSSASFPAKSVDLSSIRLLLSTLEQSRSPRISRRKLRKHVVLYSISFGSLLGQERHGLITVMRPPAFLDDSG